MILKVLSCAEERGTHSIPKQTLSRLMNSFWPAGMSGHQVIQQLDSGYRLPQPVGCPDLLYKIMQQCWSAEPDARPSFESLREQLEILTSICIHLPKPRPQAMNRQDASKEAKGSEEDWYDSSVPVICKGS